MTHFKVCENLNREKGIRGDGRPDGKALSPTWKSIAGAADEPVCKDGFLDLCLLWPVVENEGANQFCGSGAKTAEKERIVRFASAVWVVVPCYLNGG